MVTVELVSGGACRAGLDGLIPVRMMARPRQTNILKRPSDGAMGALESYDEMKSSLSGPLGFCFILTFCDQLLF